MKIEKLIVYPIKSCGGIEVEILNITHSGPAFDRRYVLVDEKGGFLSQRTYPRMCLIKTTIGGGPKNEMSIWVDAPGMERHRIPISHGEWILLPEFTLRKITIHKDTCDGIDLGNQHAKWFSSFLGQSCRLIRQVSSLPRIRTPSSLGREIQVSFADGYPLLVTTVSSLDDLNRRIHENGEDAAPMNRFRPNIVLKGCEAYAEDDWKGLQIGGVQLLGANNCVRCIVTTTNQSTSERLKEPLRTLASYRKSDKGIEFGRNFAVTKPGMIILGQEAEVLT